MKNHIPTRAGRSDNPEPAETPQHERRFGDQRGIALQTIIIIVVLMAIAGGIAAVLFSRASDETERLENVESIYGRITDADDCTTAGGTMDGAVCKGPGE